MSVSIAYDELSGSGVNEYDESGGSARRVLLCDFGRAEELCRQLLGTTRSLGQFQKRMPPERHPRRAWLYACRTRYEGIGVPGEDGTAITYPKARVTVDYRPLDRTSNHEPETTFITERCLPGWQVELSTSIFEWSAGPDMGQTVNDETTFSLLVPLPRVLVDIYHWFAAPVESGLFESLSGTVNAAAFRPLHVSWPAETLMLANVSHQRDWTSDGASGWRVRLLFVYRRGGWNKLRHTDGAHYSIATSAGSTPYEVGDHSVLLP